MASVNSLSADTELKLLERHAVVECELIGDFALQRRRVESGWNVADLDDLFRECRRVLRDDRGERTLDAVAHPVADPPDHADIE